MSAPATGGREQTLWAQKLLLAVEAFQALCALEARLELYRLLADPVSFESALMVVHDLRRRLHDLGSLHEAEMLQGDVVRLGRALERAIDEWRGSESTFGDITFS